MVGARAVHRDPQRHRGRIEIRVAGAPVVALLPAEGRVRVGLVMAPLDRVIDVSGQPAAACETLRGAAERAQRPSAAVDAEARTALLEARDRCASWAPPADAGLLAGFGGAAFPLLAAAYDGGSAPVREVPRWAEAVVAARTAREGAVAAFGDRTTRPVVRALAHALRSDVATDVDFSNLALAMIGRDVLQPDCLARVLGADGVRHPAEHLPDPSTLDDARRTLQGWGAVRAERVLLDAATTAGGLALLLDTVRYARQLRGHGPATLPNRLVELHDLHRTRVASAPRERPRPAPQPPRARCPSPVAPSRQPVHRLFAPPSDLQPVTAGTPLPATPALADLDGRAFGGLRVVVPRTAGDLVRWGRVLSNCIGGFGPAVAAGRSTIVGIEQADALAFAVEVGSDGVIRQFAGHANRAPSAAVRTATVRALLAGGLLDRHAPGNAPWFAELPPGT